MKKTVGVCDFCKDRDNLAVRTCSYCNRDLCIRHAKRVSLSLYGSSRYEDDGDTTTLKLSVGYVHPNSTVVYICPDCEKVIRNILNILSKGDKEHILSELIEFMKTKAEVEAI